MAPVVPLAAPPTLSAHNSFLREDSKHPVNGNCSPNNNNSNNLAGSQNGDTKQLTLISHSSPLQQQQQHNSQQAAPEHVADERVKKDLNDSLIVGRGGTRASLSITAGQELVNGRRTVRWSDRHGIDLVEVWEFQPSDSSDSDDEDEDDSQACTCVIV